MSTFKWTSRDLETLPDNGKLYEVIEGELYVSKQPHLNHQIVGTNIVGLLKAWSAQNHLGVAIFTPGIIFADDDDVVPDAVWISHQRLASALEPDGKLHSAPELVVEVLSPGDINERRDRETKLKLYSRRGALEYWIINWRTRQIEVFRREETTLKQVNIVYEHDALQSPFLPGFHCQAREVFADIVSPSQ
jgi:Uma2 family endonuclease